MSPTLMCTRSKCRASMVAWVPLPLPCTPMITYFRMTATLRRFKGGRQGKAEPLTEKGYVVPVGGPRRVAGVPAHRPLRCLAPHGCTGDRAPPGQRLLREDRAADRRTVVQESVRQW